MQGILRWLSSVVQNFHHLNTGKYMYKSRINPEPILFAGLAGSFFMPESFLNSTLRKNKQHFYINFFIQIDWSISKDDWTYHPNWDRLESSAGGYFEGEYLAL